MVDIRIGMKHARLDAIAPWAFVSACNPASRRSDDNPERHQALIEKLGCMGYAFHPGIGVPDEEGWIAEESVLVSGMTEADAILVGREFGQNAIVVGEANLEARLVFCVRGSLDF